MNDEKEKIKMRKKNMKLYPIYEMVGFDLLFFYGIKVLFLTQIVNITEADVLLGSSFYALFTMLLQIPVNMLANRLSARKLTIIGNIFNLISITMIIFCKSFTMYIIEEFFSAVAFSLKNISQTSILSHSIPKSRKKNEIFTKIHSRGYSKHCYAEAITTIIAGRLYDINEYIPMILCWIVVLFSIILSNAFYDIKEDENKHKKSKKGIKAYYKDVKTGFQFIIKSNRLRGLLLMLGVMWGVISVAGTYEAILLQEIDLSGTIIGLIFAFLSIAKGKIAKQAHAANKKLKNRTLTVLGILLTFSFIISGGVALFSIDRNIGVMFIIMAFLVEKGVHGIYQVLKPVYLNNFSNRKISPKIYSANTIVTNLFKMTIGFIGSCFLGATDIKYSMLIFGSIFTLIILLISKYMRSRVGLKPEEYKETDVKFFVVE